jgi:hypothetical protein
MRTEALMGFGPGQIKSDMELYLANCESLDDMLAATPRLEEWSTCISRGPQGHYEMTLAGIVAGHPNLPNGSAIETSAVAWLDQEPMGADATGATESDIATVRVVDAQVVDDKLVIVVAGDPGMSLYDLAAAERAIEAAFVCEVDVVTERMIKSRNASEIRLIRITITYDAAPVGYIHIGAVGVKPDGSAWAHSTRPSAGSCRNRPDGAARLDPSYRRSLSCTITPATFLICCNPKSEVHQ